MNFSDQHIKIKKAIQKPGLARHEEKYLAMPSLFNSNTVVEQFLGTICGKPCLFAFKSPLGPEFNAARQYAVNCLMIRTVYPKKAKLWIDNCLNCMDCLLIAYAGKTMRDPVAPLKKNGSIQSSEIYSVYEKNGGKPGCAGAYMRIARENYAQIEYIRLNTADGTTRIQPLYGYEKMRIYNFTFQLVKATLKIMIPLYKTAFPGQGSGG